MTVSDALRRFPFIWDHSVIPYERETPSILQLTHVLIGEPVSTSPGHALMTRRSISKIDSCPPVQSKPSDDRHLSSALGTRFFAVRSELTKVDLNQSNDAVRAVCRTAVTFRIAGVIDACRSSHDPQGDHGRTRHLHRRRRQHHAATSHRRAAGGRCGRRRDRHHLGRRFPPASRDWNAVAQRGHGCSFWSARQQIRGGLRAR